MTGIDTLYKPNIAEISAFAFWLTPKITNESPSDIEALNDSTIIIQRSLDNKESENKDKTPYTFDLAQERELVNKFGSAYWHFFREQTIYYLQEVYGKVPISDHYHDIEINSEGKAELWYGEGSMRRNAKESYAIPANDLSLPDWLRARYRQDVVWAEAMEEYINVGYQGPLFDVSPTAKVAKEQKMPWGLNSHSFSRFSQVEILIDEEGKEKTILRTYNLRNYLDEIALEDLFENVTGERVGVDNLLGTVKNALPGHTPESIRQMGHILYQDTPNERKIEIPKEDQIVKTAQEIVQFTNNLNNLLEGIFLMMQDPKISDLEVEKMFHGFEMEIKDMIEGKISQVNILNQVDSRSFLNKDFRNSSVIVELTQRQYQPGTSDCPGAGSGFSERTYSSSVKSFSIWGSSVRNSGWIPTGISSSQSEKKWKYEIGDCRICKEKNIKVGPCKICKTCEKKFD